MRKSTRVTLAQATYILSILATTSVLAAETIDPRGPIEYAGMKPAANKDGVQVRGYQFVNDCQKQSPWLAKWIWLGGESQVAVGLFRKEVTLTEAPRQVKAWVTADTKYRLYVNGRLVSRGPVDIGRDFAGGQTHRWFYDYRDLSHFFTKGKNSIAVEVFRDWPVSTVSQGRPGLLFEAEVTMPTQGRIVVKSDTTWRGTAAPQLPNSTTYNAGKEAIGWRLAGFDDSAWPGCQEVKDVWSPLVPSEMPPLMEARYPVLKIEGLPNRTISKDCSFRVVFDRVLSAYPTIKVKGGRGATMYIRAHHGATVLLGGGEQYYEFPMMSEIVPAFTVELKNVTEPVEIIDVGANFTSQPVEYRGSFECSDGRLNRLWKVSRWAVQICMQTHHLDSPNHQEPISDPGDYLIESMVSHYAFAQPWLARQDIRKFAWLLKDENYRNFHTSYSIGWLQMLLDYYDYTGDKTLVEEMAPYVRELLDTYTTWRGRNGLISEAPNYMFMDWVDIGGFGCHHPPAVIGQGYLTAFYCHGLDMASRVAKMTGHKARVQDYARLRRETAQAFNRELWVADKGIYRDGKPFQTLVKPYGWLPPDRQIETFSPHVNLLAVLYDLAPKERQAAIVEKVLAEKPLNTQPWFMHWVFQSIDHAGLFEKYGTSQIRRWRIVPETQSFREMWNGGDLSHGWCSTPLVQMSSRILGVRPASPGFKTILIRPQLCDLTWAKGSVPTPLGNVAVAWTLMKDKLELDVTIPAGGEAEVVLPLERFDKPAVGVDGKSVAGVIRLAAGQHRIIVTGKLAPQPDFPVEEVDEEELLESHVVKDDLVRRFLAGSEDHCSHAGGGNDASAVLNGTTHNGSGGTDTLDDGKTFRGYGTGDWLTVRFKQPCNISEFRTFASHGDARASQHYTVLVAHSAAPDRFEKLAVGKKESHGGATELRLKATAQDVIAVRFEFHGGPLGFNVYREIQVLGVPVN